MKKMDRRDFLKNVAIGGAVLGLGSAVLHKPIAALASGKHDIGQCKSVKIRCISELGWYDSKKLGGQMKDAGGPTTNQWVIPWDYQNAAGSSSLIEVEMLDGSRRRILLDTGWHVEYMDGCFKREGVDKMLKNGEIDFLYISHEHLDHFWGLEATLRHNPQVKIVIPSTFYSEGMHFIKGAEYVTPSARNAIQHKGELVKCEPGKVSKLFDGCASVTFDLPIIIRVQGEQSLYFNVKDKGIVCVTGCCHQGILTFADFARKNIQGGERMYGLYGGLHIAPFGPIERPELITGMAEYDFQKVACNHCTGLSAVEKMIELGYPVVRGTGKFTSSSDLFVGASDEVVFG
jgi:7,8-dihydropterin-6-yl-methyl-4-(beta-D-ribofuranosyl)aminobenzene 5'-phosphate synthase